MNQLIQGVEDAGAFADLVAFYLELPTQDKQKLLETLDDEERMRRALVAVERELARINAQEEIQAKVQTELGERQREMATRFGVNIAMYALTGNYKADQVHVPDILERLGQ